MLRFLPALIISGCCLPAAFAGPVVFWAPDQVSPGDVVLLYGGELATAKKVLIRKLKNDSAPPQTAGTPADRECLEAEALQPTDSSVKFVLPATLKAGAFAVEVVTAAGTTAPRVLNRPELWFALPARLMPGLAANRLASESEVQIIGKSLLLKCGGRPRAMVRTPDGKLTAASVLKAEQFSLTVQLPSLAPGRAELFIHNSFGGAESWSEPLAIAIAAPEPWPAQRFNVRDFGAKGDDVTDDTRAIRDALAAAAKNGGGIVDFPWGTYRLSDFIVVPEKTVLRGEMRDATLLKWPIDPPTSTKDFAKAAIYLGPKCGIENLTLVARKYDAIAMDVQVELNYARSVAPEAQHRIAPWGRGGDIFIRGVTFHHLLLAGRPEQQKSVLEEPALQKKLWEGCRNLYLAEARNCEVSDCTFEGGDQQFLNLIGGRIVRNSFANHMGYCWTALGGGAVDAVCEGNAIDASSSWGWGWSGINRVYSAHNVTRNFVRGEREAMTLDVSALPTARPATQYWGTPSAVDGTTLKFPDAPNGDGFAAKWVPDCFRGGTVTIRAFRGGSGAGQSRTIVGNGVNSLTLDKPFGPAPETAFHSMYLEVAPRHARAQGGTTAWIGTLAKSEARSLTAKEAHWMPQEFIGMAAFVFDGKGAGQYRVIAANTKDTATLEKAWDVIPDESSIVGVWSLMRHMIVADTQAYDTSAFAQMYGSFFEYTVDGCRVDRSQGLWGQYGWFTQFRDNSISYAHSYHPGIGMRGSNPEKNAPFGYVGLDATRIRVTKSAAPQYPDQKMPLFADEILGKPIPTTFAHIERGNVLRYGERFIVQGGWSSPTPPGPRPGGELFRDCIFDDNAVEHSAVGIQLGPNVGHSILARNRFRDVARPLDLANPQGILDLGPGPDGERLFADGTLAGWVEEQHGFFKEKNPGAKTWSVQDGIVKCDGSLGNCGFLRMDRKIDDFTLRLEYRMDEHCNSGVCIRVPKPYTGEKGEDLPSKTGYEVQIFDDANLPATIHSSGALYNAVAPEVSAAKPAGEWNELEIVCRGPKIRVTLNGRIVQDVNQLEVPAIRDRPRSGYLMLQNHGHRCEFRNLILTESARPR